MTLLSLWQIRPNEVYTVYVTQSSKRLAVEYISYDIYSAGAALKSGCSCKYLHLYTWAFRCLNRMCFTSGFRLYVPVVAVVKPCHMVQAAEEDLINSWTHAKADSKCVNGICFHRCFCVLGSPWMPGALECQSETVTEMWLRIQCKHHQHLLSDEHQHSWLFGVKAPSGFHMWKTSCSTF